jgi:hypothetical protein
MELLPPFDANGNLPAGEHHPTRADFESRFVHVPNSTTRSAIYNGWNLYRAALQNVGIEPAATMLLDGSFTTHKRDPADLDLAVEVDASDMAAAAHLVGGPQMKNQYLCDAYGIVVYPVGTPEHASTEAMRAYWRKWFARDRAGNTKGIVFASVGGLP